MRKKCKSMLGGGILIQTVNNFHIVFQGKEYALVVNPDNVAAVVDPSILEWILSFDFLIFNDLQF